MSMIDKTISEINSIKWPGVNTITHPTTTSIPSYPSATSYPSSDWIKAEEYCDDTLNSLVQALYSNNTASAYKKILIGSSITPYVLDPSDISEEMAFTLIAKNEKSISRLKLLVLNLSKNKNTNPQPFITETDNFLCINKENAIYNFEKSSDLLFITESLGASLMDVIDAVNDNDEPFFIYSSRTLDKELLGILTSKLITLPEWNKIQNTKYSDVLRFIFSKIKSVTYVCKQKRKIYFTKEDDSAVYDMLIASINEEEK